MYRRLAGAGQRNDHAHHADDRQTDEPAHHRDIAVAHLVDAAEHVTHQHQAELGEHHEQQAPRDRAAGRGAQAVDAVRQPVESPR